jgi:hypothetical protein
MKNRIHWRRLVPCIVAPALFLSGVASAQHAFDGNILYNNAAGNCRTGGSATFDGCTLLRTLFTHNDEVDPQLANPYDHTSPSWVPAPTSPALGDNDQVVVPVVHADPCYNCGFTPSFARPEPVCYRGGVPPAAWGSDWTQGWTYNNETGAGRTDLDYTKPVVLVQGDITVHTTWTSANNYLLRGRINVLPPATLTIQPGTAIFGEKATLGFLVIERGAKIDAQGTAAQPIIMTSDQLPGEMASGDWGGLMLCGYAIANCADCIHGQSCFTEGTEAFHCGNDDCDNSGTLRYVRVEYAGHEISLNNELNAFTFCSIGINTRAEYLNAFRGKDDCFEWFGGKMTAKHLLGVAGGDDGLDWQMGFRGLVQFAVIQAWGDNSCDKGIEADNNEFDYNAPCRSNPVIANVTLVNTDQVGGTSTRGIHLRRGTDAQIYDSIVLGWKTTGIDITDNETSARGAYADVPLLLCSGPAGVEPIQAASDLIVRTFPNPVVNSAHFLLRLPADGAASLRVFDSTGREVASLIDANLPAGDHQAVWNLPGDRAAGAYYYRCEAAGRVATGRLITLR